MAGCEGNAWIPLRWIMQAGKIIPRVWILELAYSDIDFTNSQEFLILSPLTDV